ncbi:hypothetical protein AgCh_037786 [Apium graveolens]
MTDNYTPNEKQSIHVEQIKLTDVIQTETPTKDISPPTVQSTNRTRPRHQVEPLQYNPETLEKPPRFKNIKMEKTNRMHVSMAHVVAIVLDEIFIVGQTYEIEKFRVTDFISRSSVWVQLSDDLALACNVALDNATVHFFQPIIIIITDFQPFFDQDPSRNFDQDPSRSKGQPCNPGRRSSTRIHDLKFDQDPSQTFDLDLVFFFLPAKILRAITASRSSKPFLGALLQMADKKMTRLAKMNVARKSNEFPIRSRYTSLIDMINTRGDEYPSDAHLDAHDHISALRDPKELEKLSSCFKIKEPFKLVLTGSADRACQWKKDALCVYRDTLRAALANSPPNSWRLILCYLSQCAKHKVPTSVAVFRKIFQFKNSPDKSPGWVSLNQRPTIPRIVNGKSIPDNNLEWKKDFLFVVWEGGDWGTLFRSSFGLAVDGSPNDITLSEEEARAFNLLTQDNGTSHSWDFIRETILVERGLSPVPKKSKIEKIEEATKPKDLEITRMKRAGKVFKDPRLGDRFPEFLLQAMEPDEEGPGQVLRTKQRPGAYFQPAWGIRGKDSIVGSTALSKEWSKHSISPVDYQDFVIQQDLEGNELFGAQALATANAHFQGAIHQTKAWKVGPEDANKKLEEANQRIEALEAQLASSTSDLETARAENVILKAQKDKAFDGWMDTQEFKDLMVEHDALLHPVSYKEGWDAAVEAIQDEFPEVLEQSSFPCPVRVPELGGVTEKLADMIKDGEEEDSSEEEFEHATKKVRVEELPRAAPQQPTSPAEGTSTGTSEGTTETSEGTTETSGETSDSGSEESQPSKG